MLACKLANSKLHGMAVIFQASRSDDIVRIAQLKLHANIASKMQQDPCVMQDTGYSLV